MIGLKISMKFKFLSMLKDVLPIRDIFLFDWTYTQLFTIAMFNKSGLKPRSLKNSDVFINWEWKLFLPLQCKSDDIKRACLTRDSSSLDCIYKMYLRIFLWKVIFKVEPVTPDWVKSFFEIYKTSIDVFGPQGRRRLVVYILKWYFRLSKKSFVVFKIWFAARILIAIFVPAMLPAWWSRDPKSSFRLLFNQPFCCETRVRGQFVASQVQ